MDACSLDHLEQQAETASKPPFQLKMEGLLGKDAKPGLLGGGSSPLEQSPSCDSRGPSAGYI